MNQTAIFNTNSHYRADDEAEKPDDNPLRERADGADRIDEPDAVAEHLDLLVAQAPLQQAAQNDVKPAKAHH